MHDSEQNGLHEHRYDRTTHPLNGHQEKTSEKPLPCKHICDQDYLMPDKSKDTNLNWDIGDGTTLAHYL
jgi:hypothetical protein